MTAHVFLRYVDPDREDVVKRMGFRKFSNETEPPIWKLEGTLILGNPLRDMDTKEIAAYIRSRGLAGQIYEAVMWGLCPD